MTEFLVERYVSRADGAALEQDAERARVAAEELTRVGMPVRYLRSIFIPEDETCLHLYEAATAEQVGEAARRAGFEFDRISETVGSARSRSSE